jgi:predicted RNase H-like nuclease (RuvC/YqgF family)
MISQEHSSLEFEPSRQPRTIGSRIFLGSAFALGVIAIATSGFLVTQVRPLQQRVSELNAAVQTQASGSQEGMTTLKTQVSSLDQTVKTQSSQLSKTDQTVANLNNQVSQLRKAQTDLKTEIAQLKSTQTNQGLLTIGSDQPQAIGSSFWVTDLKAKATNPGTTLTGSIINAGYIRHTNASFRLTVAGQSKSVVINQMGPSASQKFAVTFPNVAIACAVTAPT